MSRHMSTPYHQFKPYTVGRWLLWSLYALLKLKISQVAPILPFLLLVLMLVFRPRGLLGTREG